jgi:hypothetical protein
MTLIKKIEHVKAIKIRDKDVDIIKKSGETIPLVGGRRPLIHFEGKLQLDVDNKKLIFDDATCTIKSHVFGPVITCKDSQHVLLDVPPHIERGK